MSSSLFERVSALSFDLPLLDEPKPHEKELLRDDEAGRVGDVEASWVATRAAFGMGAALRLLKDGMGLVVQEEKRRERQQRTGAGETGMGGDGMRIPRRDGRVYNEGPMGGSNKSPRTSFHDEEVRDLLGYLPASNDQSPPSHRQSVPRTVQAVSLLYVLPSARATCRRSRNRNRHNARATPRTRNKGRPVQGQKPNIRGRLTRVVHHSWPSPSPLGHPGPAYFNDQRSAAHHEQRQLNYVDPTHHNS